MMLTAMFSIRKFAQENKKISAYTPAAQEKFYQMNLRFKKSSFRHMASLGEMVNRYKTQSRDYPLLIGVGEHDNAMAIEAAKQWHAHEKESTLVIFKGAGHIVSMDTPDEFNRTLEKIVR